MVKKKKKKKIQWSKFLAFLVILCGFIIAEECIILIYICIKHNFTSTAAYLTAAIGLAEAVIGVGVNSYLSLCKSDHKGANGDGITYASAKAKNFMENNEDEPSI